ncbi:MAG: 16S rRNA (uracil(1498)-N(3))-methyltransferase [Chthonomonas sp.]|nr:16S rRNA (uracil(1498)-N(3))-methyltransferase [Chthonomonas sp.]
MDSRSLPPLRSLPRFFIDGLDPEVDDIEIPEHDLNKLRKVLRLGTGDFFGALPNDGTLWVCELRGRSAVVRSRHPLDTEPKRFVRLAQALPKADKLEEIVRMATEIGVSEFILFSADRSVVKWTPDKLADRMRRLSTIAREAAELSYRARVPVIRHAPSLGAVLEEFPEACVLSELASVEKPAILDSDDEVTLVIGPEGGWAPREVTAIAHRSMTFGPRVLRTETSAVAAATLALLVAK